MKALQTQFDDRRLSNAVATPTCSSCCCCCCCLATSITSSTLLAQRIAKEGKKHQVFNRHMLTVLAALFVPVVGLLVYFGFWTISKLLRHCTEVNYTIGSSQNQQYTVCTTPSLYSLVPLLFIATFVVLLYLYARVRIEKPVKRAGLVAALILVAFVGEFIGGAALILTGVGGPIYLILVPIVIGWITVWYHRHLGKESDGTAIPATPVAPTVGQATDHHEDTSKPTEPHDPTWQNPAAPGPQ